MLSVSRVLPAYPVANRLERAILIAVQVFAGRVDQGGAPAILHALRVMLDAGPGENAQIVGVLHDVVEETRALPVTNDTRITAADLRLQFDAEIGDALEAITRREMEPYSAYIERVKRNELARHVKKADLRHNLDRARVPVGMHPKMKDLWERYRRALLVLGGPPYEEDEADGVIVIK